MPWSFEISYLRAKDKQLIIKTIHITLFNLVLVEMISTCKRFHQRGYLANHPTGTDNQTRTIKRQNMKKCNECNQSSLNTNTMHKMRKRNLGQEQTTGTCSTDLLTLRRLPKSATPPHAQRLCTTRKSSWVFHP